MGQRKLGAPAGTVGVLGLGIPGTRLLLQLVKAGVPTIGVDPDADATHRCHEAVTDAGLDIGPGRVVCLAPGTDVLKDASVVIETVRDTPAAKQAVLRQLDRACPDAIALVTTASTQPVSELASVTRTPARVVGLRFAPAGRLAEIVRTGSTAATGLDRVQDLLRRIGSASLVVPDLPCSPARLLQFGLLARAAAMCDTGFASAEDIDTAMRLGCGMPQGPLEMLDEIGLDTACGILAALHRETGRAVFSPVPVLRGLVAAGRLGRHVGKGFFTYPGGVQAAAGGTPTTVAPCEPDEHADATRPRTVRTVGVVGSGIMATGIAEVMVAAGYDTLVTARDSQRAARAAAVAAARAERRRARPDDGVPGRVTAGSLADVADRDLVIEAVAEDRAVKNEVFRQLGEICRDGAVLATTTSSIPVIDCALAAGRPADVIGMHFFNPPAAMGVVEVAATARTAPDTVATACAVVSRLGKRAVVCGDRAGFIVNLLLFPVINEGIELLAAGQLDARQLDVIGRLGCGLSVGLVRLLDVVGTDLTVQVLENLRDELSDPEFAPAPLLQELVRDGFIGNKAGRSVRDHPALRKSPAVQRQS